MKNLGGYFDLDKQKNEVNVLENELNDSNIWNDVNYANDISKKLAVLKKNLSDYYELIDEINSLLDIIELLKIENDLSLQNELDNKYASLIKLYDDYRVKLLFKGEFDDMNCYLEIHPGAGGTESCDWASMLLRMYQMFFEKNNYQYEIINYQAGDEAGIKSVMIRVCGDHAYGYLKGEIGVHRLVRISPFNAAGKRQTSFAAVNIIPDIDKEIDIDIKDDDLKIDVFRSSGKGGQGVNTTDSAVRITHLPTGIVVSVQNERSQLKNKEIALKILKNRLYIMEKEKKKKEIDSLKGSSDINFGSQIRNYVLEPYSLVKDLRSNHESSNPLDVLDGNLLPFLIAYLKGE